MTTHHSFFLYFSGKYCKEIHVALVKVFSGPLLKNNTQEINITKQVNAKNVSTQATLRPFGPSKSLKIVKS